MEPGVPHNTHMPTLRQAARGHATHPLLNCSPLSSFASLRLSVCSFVPLHSPLRLRVSAVIPLTTRAHAARRGRRFLTGSAHS